MISTCVYINSGTKMYLRAEHLVLHIFIQFINIIHFSLSVVNFFIQIFYSLSSLWIFSFNQILCMESCESCVPCLFRRRLYNSLRMLSVSCYISSHSFYTSLITCFLLSTFCLCFVLKPFCNKERKSDLRKLKLLSLKRSILWL